MIVGKADAEIGAGSAEMQRRIALLVQPVGASVQVRVVLFPRGHRIRLVRARRGEDRVPKPRQRFVRRQIGKYRRRPCGSGAGYDGPVDLVAGDQFQRGAVRFRGGAIHAAHLFRILPREQRRIVAGNREPRRAAPVRLRHAFIEPRGGGVEAGVLSRSESEAAPTPRR